MADNNIENEPGQPAPQGQQTHEGQQAQDHGGNPWGADFDAQRAWNKQQALIEENKRLKERPVLTDEQKQQLQRLQELEEASRTDAERQAEKIASLTEAAGQVPTLQTENLRLRVALEKELPANLATRLQGGTREELEADADALKGLIGQSSSPQQSQPGMRPNPAQGTSGGGTGPSIEDLVTEARKTGNTREAVRLESMKLLNLPTP
jgi:hypothetical protein